MSGSLDFKSQFRKVPRIQQFAYAFGQIPERIMAGIFAIMYVEFFWEDLGLIEYQSLFIWGQVIYATINSLNDPIFGYLTDRTNVDKWGSRRLVHMRYGSIIWGILFTVMWFPWSTSNITVIFIHYILAICAFDTIYTLVVQSWLALSSEITEDVSIRNRLSFLANIFMIVGMIPSLFIRQIYERNITMYYITVAICAAFSIASYLWVTYTVKERPELRMEKQESFWKQLWQALQSRAFIMRTFYYYFTYIEFSLMLSFLFAYVYVFDIGGFTTMAIYIAFFGIGWISQVLYMQVAKKWGMRDTILTFKSMYVIASIVGYLTAIQRPTTLVVWICFGMKTFFSGYMVFNYPMLTLVIDEDEVRHGSRREGLFMGVGSAIFKSADSLGPIIGTSILLAFGYVENAVTQSLFTLEGIKFMLFLVPALTSSISLLFLIFFPLHGKRLENMQRDLLVLHGEKAKKYLKKE
jgi:GPH family glycoside/pentoside/hexuronide:cation symporter